MPLPGRSSESDNDPAPRPDPVPPRIGKPMPGYPIGGKNGFSRASLWLLAICIALALILRTTAAAEAQGPVQDWLPGVLEMSDDVEVPADGGTGSGTRMLIRRTPADADALLIERKGALRAEGPAIGHGRDEALAGIIGVNGTGIVNARTMPVRVAAAPAG